MNTIPTNHTDKKAFDHWKERNFSDEEILEELRRSGLDETEAIERIISYRRYRNDQRQSTGFILTGLGAFIGFLSCVFTMLDLDPGLRGFMLYGLTGIGLVLMFVGLFLVFE